MELRLVSVNYASIFTSKKIYNEQDNLQARCSKFIKKKQVSKHMLRKVRIPVWLKQERRLPSHNHFYLFLNISSIPSRAHPRLTPSHPDGHCFSGSHAESSYVIFESMCHIQHSASSSPFPF